MDTFVHLHTHSHYSLLSALPKVHDLVRAARERGVSTLALTDDGNLYGAIQFYRACTGVGLKPIIGVDCYLAARSRADREPGIDSRSSRLVLLARDERGYRNLIKLVTESYLNGFYYKPRIDRELIERHREGLVCIIPALESTVSDALRAKNTAEAAQRALWYKSTFGDGAAFLEVTHHPELPGHEALTSEIVSLGAHVGMPLVAAHEVRYLDPEDRTAYETLLSIQGGPPSERSFEGGEADLSFVSGERMREYFRDLPEALEGTAQVAELCNLELSLGQWFFPKIETQGNRSHEETLARLVEEGARAKDLEETAEVRERLAFELTTITEKGYAPYFLVVEDLLRYAHERSIFTTVRGSVAGSLVSYVLGITNINPLEYGLPFERFLNPERPLPPDIDMDFADNRRDEVLEYARTKYGKENVAQIGTFGTLMARAAIRDVARALGYDYATGDTIAKLVPFGAQGFPMTIDHALEQEPELKNRYDTDEATERIIDMAKKIEGNARHISVHAAGVVISPIPLNEIVPVQYDTKGEGKLITQYDMHAVEDIGLLKFDFLGLKNLTILADAIDRVRKLYGIDLDVEQLPLDDTKTFEMLARGETAGVFQLSGGAMTAFLRELKPTTIDDINAMIALYRPGPMRNIPEYIARKHGRKQVTYYHPKMKQFLERSYGILVYQDDLLSTALEVAGYTWKNVDKFRKAVGKKIPAEMAKQHDIFVDGCIMHSGMTRERAEGLWKLFEPFQGYGFNKAHAASYGRLAYQTAYMKANFPAVYMAALLTADAGDIDRVSETIAECKRMEIDVFPPDINHSIGVFSIAFSDGDFAPPAPERQAQVLGIRFGLHSIKNLGTSVADSIIEERKRGGSFTSLEQFLERIQDKNLNKKALEALVACGALDDFGERGVLLANLDDIISYGRSRAAVSKDQSSLFALMGDDANVPALRLKSAEPATKRDKLVWEKELIGLYISGHPLDEYGEMLDRYGTNLALLKAELEPGTSTTVLGVVDEVHSISTRSGERMAFVRVSDPTDSIEVVVFPKLFQNTRALLAKQGCIQVRGTLSNRNGRLSILAESIRELKQDGAIR